MRAFLSDKRINISLLVMFFCVVTSSISAQSTYTRSTKTGNQTVTEGSAFKGRWTLSVGGGPTLFFGDMKQYRYYPVTNYESEWRFGGNLTLERSISPVFSIRGQGLYSELAGTRRAWKSYFNAELIEFNLSTAVNLNNLIGGFLRDKALSINIIVGLGVLNYNTTVYELGSNKTLSQLGYGSGIGIGGRTLEGMLMGGLGIDYHLNDNWAIRFESANRGINSDLLDNYANMFKYDVYNHTSLGIAYTFNRRIGRIKLVPEDSQEVVPLTMPLSGEEPVQPENNQNPQGINAFNRVIDVLDVDAPKEEPQEPEIEVVKETFKPKYVNSVGIEYRVQIRARYGHQISTAELARTYSLPQDEIMESTHKGYFIYTIGNFATYDEAVAKRNSVRSQNKVYDAFIVAFKNGARLDKLP